MPGQVIERLIIQFAGDGRKYAAEIRKMKKENKTFEDSIKTVSKVGGAAFLSLGAAATALGFQATRAFVKFEKGVTNVAKTTNLAGKDLEEFKQEILDMSTEIPVTTDRLLEIATAAGQLGIKGTKNLSKFTEVIAKLGATTNVEGEDAALTLARLLNLTNESVDSVDKLGSALVDLGNNFAASEAEILEVSKDVAKAVVQFDLASNEILGISAAMASLGIQAEAGGTVIGKAFQSINEAVRKGAGPAFNKLVELTNMTGDELKQTFQDDAAVVFQAFIEGLGKAGEKGKDMSAELNKLGLSGIRVEKILPTLADRADILSAAMERAGLASKDAAALNKEAAQAFATNASRLEIANNKIGKSLISMGENFVKFVVPAFEAVGDSLEAMVQGRDELEVFVGKGIEASEKVAKELKRVAEEGQSYVDSWQQHGQRVVDNWVAAENGRVAATKRAQKQIEAVDEETNRIREEKAKQDKSAEKRRMQQEKEDAAMFESIQNMTDDVVWEYQQRQMQILEGAMKFNNEFVEIIRDGNDVLDDERKAAFAERLDLIREGMMTIGEIEAEGYLDRERAQIEEHNRFLKEEMKFGTAMAKVKQFQRKSEFQQTKTAANELAQLVDSENKQMSEIGKKATIIQMTISTAESAIKAYNSLAWIPYVGPALGAAAAALIAGYGAEQVGKVNAMQQGGLVPGVGTGDKVPTLLEPGELVVPRSITREILDEYGARKFQDGGRVPGDKEKTDLNNTFQGIFQTPEVFKAIIAGDDPDYEVKGFGGEAFARMIKPMIEALKPAADQMMEEQSNALRGFGGDIMYRIFRLTNLPTDEISKLVFNNPALDALKNVIGTDAFDKILPDNVFSNLEDNALGQIKKSADRLIGDFVSDLFGFQGGGVVGMTEPGEMRLSRKALSAIADGVSMSKGAQANGMNPSIRSSGSSGGRSSIMDRLIVELSMNDNAAEVINAQIREGKQLGTLKPA